MTAWSTEPPTEPGWYWVRTNLTAIFGPLLGEVYESATGLRVKGQCCACEWRGTPLVSEVVEDGDVAWSGPIEEPKP